MLPVPAFPLRQQLAGSEVPVCWRVSQRVGPAGVVEGITADVLHSLSQSRASNLDLSSHLDAFSFVFFPPP